MCLRSLGEPREKPTLLEYRGEKREGRRRRKEAEDKKKRGERQALEEDEPKPQPW